VRLAEANRAHLGQAADWLSQAFLDGFDAGNKRCANAPSPTNNTPSLPFAGATSRLS
jgi:hypothetical protein